MYPTPPLVKTFDGVVDAVGGTLSNVTTLSVLVEAPFWLPPLLATPAGMLAMTVPLVIMPETATLYVVPLPETLAAVAPAVPLSVTSLLTKLVTGALKTTVKLIVLVFEGSGWLAALSIVTVN